MTCSRSTRIELWDSAPFLPQVKELSPGRKVITGRGSSDDKGQLMLFVEACRAWKAEHGQLPCRISILFEGEEESGSPSLKPFLDANKEELKADFALVCDTDMFDTETPSICASLRGLVGEEIIIKAANRDLHSGMYGGPAANPVRILAKILADIHDETGRVTIPGFYEGVEETPSQILKSWEALGTNAENFLGPIGLSKPSGEKGRSVLEMVWARPTAEFNGISAATPARDSRRSLRPKPRRRSRSAWCTNRIRRRSVRRSASSCASGCPSDCTVEFDPHGGSPAIQLSYDSPFLAKAKSALSDEWPKPAVMVGSGGSIPIVGDFQHLSRHGIAAGRLRAFGRPHPFAKREIRPQFLPQGSALLGADPRRPVSLSR